MHNIISTDNLKHADIMVKECLPSILHRLHKLSLAPLNNRIDLMNDVNPISTNALSNRSI